LDAPGLEDGRLLLVLIRLRVICVLAISCVVCIVPSGTHSTLAGTTASPNTTAMFRGNPARTGVYPGPAPEDHIGAVWAFRASNAVLSSPAVAGDCVYVGDVVV
jgi:putative exporter of polyketide antibiotics